MPITSQPNASLQRSTAICHSLFCICYYYSRLIGIISYRIQRCDDGGYDHRRTRMPHSGLRTMKPVNTRDFNKSRFAFRAYEQKAMLWFNVAATVICCIIFTYGAMVLWSTENFIFIVLVRTHVAIILIGSLVMITVQIWHRKRMILATNNLLELLQAIEKFHGNYSIFQWTHVALVALKLLGFIVEFGVCLQSLFFMDRWIEVAEGTIEIYLMILVWMNIHVITNFYICIDAMFVSLNNYMRYDFVPRLRTIRSFGPITTPGQVNRLHDDLTKVSILYERIYNLGLELHYQWQIPVVFSILSVYCGMLSVVYYMIWQYFDTGVTHSRFLLYLVKLTLDILLLSLTAHRAIRSSRLIGWMGFENAVLVENEMWYREMELFLCRINLYDFKLNILGLFDITNALLLTFISGILTSISIFIPFSVKTYRIQKFLEQQNIN